MKDLNFNSNYTIYRDGRIFSRYRNIFISKSLDNSGYYRVNLWDHVENKNKRFLLHRLLAEHFIPNPENLPVVNHINGIKTDIALDNLEWTTSSKNQIHAYRMELKVGSKGTSNGRCTHTEEEVIEAYLEMLRGAPVAYVKRKYNFHGGTANSIKSKKIWKELLKDLPDIPIKDKRLKLEASVVINICELLVKNYEPKIISEMLSPYGVSRDQVSDIKRRRTHKKISKDYSW